MVSDSGRNFFAPSILRACFWVWVAGWCCPGWNDASAQTPVFNPGVAIGNVAPWEIWEASGLAASRQNPGVLWTHNDSGFPGTVWALSTNGALLARYQVPGVYSGNFEDIAIGPGPSPGLQYLYLGDIGDNYSTRESIRVLRFPEPAVYAYQSNAPPALSAVDAREIVLKYPDGAHNCEALLVDPLTGDLFLVIKLAESSRVYQATRAQLESGEVITLSFVRELSFHSVSAGDFSADGGLIALRRPNRANVWTRQSGQSVADALDGTAVRVPVIGQPVESNGEALAFDPTGSGYYTVSEGSLQPIYFFQRTDTGAPSQPRVLVPPGASWRYQDLGDDEGTAWREPDFDDSAWAPGAGQFGYGQGDEQTEISVGWDWEFKNITTYFRTQFSIDSPAGFSHTALRVCYNDGIAVFLNGIEVLRKNLAANAAFDTPAGAPHGEWQNIWVSYPLDPALLRASANTLAVEVHRFAQDGPDLSFDLQLTESQIEAPARFAGPPEVVPDGCRLRLAGPAGSLVTVETSNDLRNWTVANQVVLWDGTGLLQERVTAGAAFFWRIVSPAGPPDY